MNKNDYYVQEKTVYEVIENHKNGNQYVMAEFETEEEAEEYKEECESNNYT